MDAADDPIWRDLLTVSPDGYDRDGARWARRITRCGSSRLVKWSPLGLEPKLPWLAVQVESVGLILCEASVANWRIVLIGTASIAATASIRARGSRRTILSMRRSCKVWRGAAR